MSITTEAASEALSDPDATQPTNLAPSGHSQAPPAAAQCGFAQAMSGATASDLLGSFGTTDSGHTSESDAQEDADDTTATSKVR